MAAVLNANNASVPDCTGQAFNEPGSELLWSHQSHGLLCSSTNSAEY